MPELWIHHRGTTLFALDQGNGRAIVVLHGGLADHRAVLPFVAPLADDFRVITPDLRGSGRSHTTEPIDFAVLRDDLRRWLDHLAIETAVIGGVSSGSGVAVDFALHHPERTAALIVVLPVYAGETQGFTASQREAFDATDAAARRAPAEGIDVLRALFDRLPQPYRERAWNVASTFDPVSVAATARFIASGAQPFADPRNLRGIGVPTLLVAGDDPQHPAEISQLYAESIPHAVVYPPRSDIASAIATFCGTL